MEEDDEWKRRPLDDTRDHAATRTIDVVQKQQYIQYLTTIAYSVVVTNRHFKQYAKWMSDQVTNGQQKSTEIQLPLPTDPIPERPSSGPTNFRQKTLTIR